MNYCWNHNRNKAVNCITNAVAVLLLSIVLVNLTRQAYSLIIAWTWSRIPTLAIMCIVVYFCGLFLLVIAAHERKYQVDEHGLTIGYPFGIQRFFAWSDIDSITICKVHYIKKGPLQYKTAIRFAIEKEKAGPEQATQADEVWSNEMYEIKHWEKVITIEFSEERLDEVIKSNAPQILDYRHLPNPR